MNMFLSDISMGLGTAYLSQIIRMIMYIGVAAIGIFVGIRLRKNKNAKNEQ